MLKEIRTGSTLALRRFRVTRQEMSAGGLAALFLGFWTFVGLSWLSARYPEALSAAGSPGLLHSSLSAFGLGCLLLPLQAHTGRPSSWDGLRGWLVLVLIVAVGVVAGRVAAPHGIAVAGVLLVGALPASLWLSGRRRADVEDDGWET